MVGREGESVYCALWVGGGGEAGRHKAHTYWWGGRERGGEALNGPQRSTNIAARGEEIAAEMMEGRRKTSDWESAPLFHAAFPILGSTRLPLPKTTAV